MAMSSFSRPRGRVAAALLAFTVGRRWRSLAAGSLSRVPTKEEMTAVVERTEEHKARMTTKRWEDTITPDLGLICF